MSIVINAWQLILLGALTLFPPLFMIAVPYIISKRLEEKLLHPMLGISAGILLGLVFFDILPESNELTSDLKINAIYFSIAVLAGFFILTMIERFMLSKGITHGHDADGVKIKPFGTLGISALVVHGFMDGFVIPISLSASIPLGLIVTIAMVIHQIPDSFAAMSMSLAAGYTKKQTVKYVCITALDTPLGILIGVCALLGSNAVGFESTIVLLSLGFSAGTFLFVSAADLIPELQHSSKSMSVLLFILLGIAIIFGLTQLLPA
jgi:ZIP family zinc transporter